MSIKIKNLLVVVVQLYLKCLILFAMRQRNYIAMECISVVNSYDSLCRFILFHEKKKICWAEDEVMTTGLMMNIVTSFNSFTMYTLFKVDERIDSSDTTLTRSIRYEKIFSLPRWALFFEFECQFSRLITIIMWIFLYLFILQKTTTAQ